MEKRAGPSRPTYAEELNGIGDIGFADRERKHETCEMIEQVPSLVLFFCIAEKEVAQILNAHRSVVDVRFE